MNKTQNNDCSIKTQLLQSKISCYLGGLHRLASCESAAALFLVESPSSVHGLVQVSGQSLEAIACCAVKSAGRISISAWICHASHWRHSHLHTRIFIFSSAALSTDSSLDNTLLDEPIIQNSSLKTHSTSWDAGCPTFLQNFCVPLGHGCNACNCLVLRS